MVIVLARELPNVEVEASGLRKRLEKVLDVFRWKLA
jgi:hypothetical protein